MSRFDEQRPNDEEFHNELMRRLGAKADVRLFRVVREGLRGIRGDNEDNDTKRPRNH